MSRPSDYVDSGSEAAGEDGYERAAQPKLDALGWLRWGWRQLITMRTALVLLLLLAVASVPGSLVPQRTADPNGVIAWTQRDPAGAAILDFFQLFDVYSSIWFSAIYLLLFISLIGCVVPRIKHHWQALRSEPPRTPSRLTRLPAYRAESFTVAPSFEVTEARSEAADDAGRASVSADPAQRAVDLAAAQLRRERYRVRLMEPVGARGVPSVSAERGYLRETGNLVFHSALVGVLVTMGLGNGWGYAGQAIVIEGETFVNSVGDYDSLTPGRFFSSSDLTPFTLTLDSFEVEYSEQLNAYGQPTDYTAKVTAMILGQEASAATVKVNHPLYVGSSQIYLLGNGYAPQLTVRDPEGTIVWQDTVPFLPQDQNLTSLGVIKVPDGLEEQVGMRGFFYPSWAELESGALTSWHPDMLDPMMTLQVYVGDLGVDTGVPVNVYRLDTENLTQIAGGDAEEKAIGLTIGDTVELPDGLGTLTLDGVKRFASFDIHREPSQIYVLVFALSALAGLLTSLFVPRRRVWVAATVKDGGLVIEYAALARGEDPTLVEAVDAVAETHRAALAEAGITPVVEPDAASTDAAGDPDDSTEIDPAGDAGTPTEK